MKFEWVTSPPAESVLRAIEGLVASGMLDADGRLTEIGEKVAECPVDVNIARMVSDRNLGSPTTLTLPECFYTVVYFKGVQMWRRDPFYSGDDYSPGWYKPSTIAARYLSIPSGRFCDSRRRPGGTGRVGEKEIHSGRRGKDIRKMHCTLQD